MSDDVELSTKASLDPGEADLGADAATASQRALQKVELDLEDAPFLEEEPPPPPPPSEDASASAGETPAAKPRRNWKALLNTKFLLLAGGVLVLAGLGMGLGWFLGRSSAPPVPPPSQLHEPSTNSVDVATSAPAPLSEVPLSLEMQPFWVERTDREGRLRFLRLKVSLMAPDQTAARTMHGQPLQVRDAIYHYLKNKPFEFLADTKNMKEFKKELALALAPQCPGLRPEGVLVAEYAVD